MANESELLDNVEVEDEQPSLRDTLEEAFDKQETAEIEAKPETPEPPASTESAAPTPAAPPSPPETPPPVTTELKAPAQWKPAVREKWNALPREVQEEVLRREADSMRLIGSVGPKIRMADELSQQIEPFRENLERSGVSPSVFLSDVFTSVKSLAQGSMQEKAETVANIVQAYGIDLRTLDQVLTGRLTTPPEVTEARRLAQQARAVLQQQQAGLQHQSALEAEKAIAAFGADPKHEFLDDVRDLMADLIESGRAKTLDDAYSAAIWAHEDTRKILLQREAQTRAQVKGQRAAAARRASSAVHGSPSAPAAAVQNNANLSLRESIEAAFDEHSSL